MKHDQDATCLGTAGWILKTDNILLRTLDNLSQRKINKHKQTFQRTKRTCIAKSLRKTKWTYNTLSYYRNILSAKQHRPMVQRAMWNIVHTMHTSKNSKGQILVCENYCDKGPGDRVLLRWQHAKGINLIGATVWEIWLFEVRIRIWINSNLNLTKVCKQDTTG